MPLCKIRFLVNDSIAHPPLKLKVFWLDILFVAFLIFLFQRHFFYYVTTLFLLQSHWSKQIMCNVNCGPHNMEINQEIKGFTLKTAAMTNSRIYSSYNMSIEISSKIMLCYTRNNVTLSRDDGSNIILGLFLCKGHAVARLWNSSGQNKTKTMPMSKCKTT